LCAWLHDLEGRKGKKLSAIKKSLKKFEQNKSIIKKVTNIIKKHSFGEKQNTLESKILYDADKLEYVNPFRLSWFILASEDGNISSKKYLSYKREWWRKIDKVEKTLHFSYSKKVFSRLLPEAKKIMY